MLPPAFWVTKMLTEFVLLLVILPDTDRTLAPAMRPRMMTAFAPAVVMVPP